MTPFHAIILFAVALLAGALNSVGGGSFFSFPMLIFTGVPVIDANATNTISLWPGSLASVVAYRRQFSTQRPVLIVLSLLEIGYHFPKTWVLLPMLERPAPAILSSELATQSKEQANVSRTERCGFPADHRRRIRTGGPAGG